MNLQQIADNLAEKKRKKDGSRLTPIGKAQSIITEALGVDIQDFYVADMFFREVGITVIPTRKGRRSVPVVKLNEGTSQRNTYGDFDIAEPEILIDVSLIEEWLE